MCRPGPVLEERVYRCGVEATTSCLVEEVGVVQLWRDHRGDCEL